jgi:hypothetical protein
MTEAKYELTSLEIDEGSLVDKGDNPEAHVRMFKRDEEPSAEEPSESRGGVLRKVWEWFGAGSAKDAEPAEAVRKDYPKTTGEILRARKFQEEFAVLRGALMESIYCILEEAPAEEISDLLAKAVAEFAAEADGLTQAVIEKGARAPDDLASIIDRMRDSVSKGENGADRAGFAEAVAELERFAFEIRAAKKEENVSNTTKSANEILAGLPAEDIIAFAESLGKKTDQETKGEHNEEDEMKEDAKKAAGQSEAIEKRMVELEKRAAEAEARVAAMVEKERSAEFVAKAKKIVPGGVDHAELGSILKAAHDFSGEHGEALERVLTALGAQVSKSALFTVVGSAAPVGKGANAHDQLETRANEIQKAAAANGKPVSFAEAYDRAMSENPALALEAVG